MNNFFKRNKRRLTREQFERAVSIVNDLGASRVMKFTEDERVVLADWLKEHTVLFNLCTLTRVDARESLLASLTIDCVRVFLLELSISFYAHGGDTDDFEERLVNSIAHGLRLDGRNPEYCELPQEILVSAPLMNFPATLWHPFILVLKRMFRLTKETTLVEYLLSNRHMQMVVLLALSNDLA